MVRKKSIGSLIKRKVAILFKQKWLIIDIRNEKVFKRCLRLECDPVQAKREILTAMIDAARETALTPSSMERSTWA